MAGEMKNIYWFEELSKENLLQAGGKGANLGEMMRAGLPIPPGFVVSVGAYYRAIRENNLASFIESKLRNLDVQDAAALQRASDEIKRAIERAPVPNDIRADIVRAYNKLCGVTGIPSANQEVLVAVRSSATAEDLPTASFAGQQATFLNVKGAEQVVDAVRRCWASLFEARAIYYRVQNGFDHMRVGLSAVVQKMIQSESSGVMFTADPVTGDASKIIIEAGFGLGEAVVSGQITPDNYIVDKQTLRILEKNISRQETMIIRTPSGATERVEVPEEIQEKQKTSDEFIVQIAKLGRAIEKHYAFPQDIEWAVERGRVYITQSRAITTIKGKSGSATEATPSEKPVKTEKNAVGESASESKSVGESAVEAKVLLRGLGASPGIASGTVKLVTDKSQLSKITRGDVLVTEMTSPDFVPAMKRASAIVTNAGGMTCHAAIVSRELGIPCVVGSKNATSVLRDGQIVTVDAKRGVVYEGKIALEAPTKEDAARNGGLSDAQAIVVAGGVSYTTGTKIYVNIADTEVAEKVAQKDVDGIGLLRAEFMIAGLGVHPNKLAKEGRANEFIDMLAENLRRICTAFDPRPVIYRANDFKTNEYRGLPGGEEFEPHEENPMIGYRGCFRYVMDPTVFKMEIEAIKKVREEYGLKNLWLMIPFVRTVEEFVKCKQICEENGLRQNQDFKLGIMCEVPSTVIMAEEFCEAGVDFMSIGSNDLTQLTLGADRDSGMFAKFMDERDPAVMRSIQLVIERCHKHGVPVGICGQAPSVYPTFAEKLVEYGIDSISVNPDVIERTRKIVASAENKVMLRQLAELTKKK
ncbi:MAG: phosphoenolpyruvate synthase [Candidatus Norongarragalinales archaeon]